MKKIICIVIASIAIMFGFAANNAQADEVSSFTRYVLDTTPAVNVTQAQRCAAAYHHGGMYRLMTSEVTLTCTKHQIHKEWDPSD